jgi:hypothetical protein
MRSVAVETVAIGTVAMGTALSAQRRSGGSVRRIEPAAGRLRPGSDLARTMVSCDPMTLARLPVSGRSR